jgi:SRSO17 transposase
MKAFSEHCMDRRSPSSLTRFLSSSTWDPVQASIEAITHVQSLKQLKTIKKGVISLDDTISEKTGKHIKSTCYSYSHGKGKTVLGHDLVALHYKDMKKGYPLFCSLYLNENASRREARTFKTRHQLGLELIQHAHSCGIQGQTILMDSWFVTSKLVQNIKKLGYRWVGRIKSNRVCFRDGMKLNVKQLARMIPDSEWSKERSLYKTHVNGKKQKYQYIASKMVDLKTLGVIKMVFVKPTLNHEVILFLGTDRVNLPAMDILKLYTERWKIETFFRDSKQKLALSGYMGRSIIGFERFSCLVFMAYLFIKYVSLMGFHGQNKLVKGETFGAELDNYHQLCFEHFISVIHDVSSEITDKSELLNVFRSYYFLRKKPKIKLVYDHSFYDLKAFILSVAG